MPGYRFNFGKFEGRNVCDVPRPYLEWIIENFKNAKSRNDRFWRWVAEEEIKKRIGKHEKIKIDGRATP